MGRELDETNVMETYCEGKTDDDLARVKECPRWCTFFTFLSIWPL
jgi:hypothetical protein